MNKWEAGTGIISESDWLFIVGDMTKEVLIQKRLWMENAQKKMTKQEKQVFDWLSVVVEGFAKSKSAVQMQRWTSCCLTTEYY